MLKTVVLCNISVEMVIYIIEKFKTNCSAELLEPIDITVSTKILITERCFQQEMFLEHQIIILK